MRTLLVGRAGVEDVEADASRKRVEVSFRPDRIAAVEIKDAVASLGFSVRSAHDGGAPSG